MISSDMSTLIFGEENVKSRVEVELRAEQAM